MARAPRTVAEKRWILAFSVRITAARERRGMKQYQLAARVGIQASELSKIERGRVSPSAFNLAKLCRILRVSADRLLDLEWKR